MFIETDWNCNQNQEISTAEINVTHIAKIILKNYVMTYKMLSYILTDNRPQFFKNDFKDLWLILKIRKLTKEPTQADKLAGWTI